MISMRAGEFVVSGPSNGLAPPVLSRCFAETNEPATVRYCGQPMFHSFKKGLLLSSAWRQCVRDPVADEFGTQCSSYSNFVVASFRPAAQLEGRLFSQNQRKYAIFKSRQAFEAFIRRVPMCNRFLEEMIFIDTPHRFYMDIERDTFPEMQEERTIKQMLEFTKTRFVQILAEFFARELGVAIPAQDFLLLDSCNHKKFSVHVTVNDGRHFCPTRKHSLVVAGLLAKYLDELEQTDAEFREWYVDSAPAASGGLKRVVDWSVYHVNTRNMRIIGAVKLSGSGSEPGTPWTSLRPLMPVDEGRPWADYLATCNNTAGLQPLPLPDTGPLKQWTAGLRAGYVASALRNKLSRVCGVTTGATAGAARNWGGGRAVGFDASIANMLRTLKNSSLDLTAYRSVASRMLQAMAKAIHPGQNYGFVNHDEAAGELLKLSTETFVSAVQGVNEHRVSSSGELKRQRLCYWSYIGPTKAPCQGGQHRAEMTVMADLSIRYFCYGCGHSDIMVYSPIQSNTVNPRMYDREAPPGFENGYVYYGNSFSDTDASRHMRPIKELPGGGLFDAGTKRTIVLHGGMGTGKSYQTNKYLEAVIPEIEAKIHRPARVLSITFRTMLARSNAKTFNLKVYNEQGLANQPLIDENRIACQLDSLLRLCCPVVTDDAEFKRADLYDVIILDESESILSHMSSKTIKDKRQAIFVLFKHLVQRANTVIAADADMGERTLDFLRRFRNLASDSVEYHRNPFLIRDMQYLDYKYFTTWMDAMIRNFLDEKRPIFIATNNKKKLRAFESQLREELQRRAEASNCPEWYLNRVEDPMAIKMITGDIDGLTKTLMAERCNEEWSRAWVLGITPVVGAGISFDREDYFHEAFLFATPSSACPRALNQLLGRVRYLKNNRVHVFIEDNPVKNHDEQLMEFDSALQMTRDRLRANTNFQLSDMVAVEDENGSIFLRCVRPDDDLLRISAFNVMENARGEHDFRREFIKVLQKNNPTVQYSFVTQGNYEKDTRALIETTKRAQVNRNLDIRHLSHSIELPHDVHRSSKRLNDSGARAMEDDFEQAEIVQTLKKNDIKNYLGLENDVSPLVIQAYSYYFMNRESCIEEIRLMCRLFFTGIADLYHDAKSRGMVDPVLFLMRENDAVVTEARAKERVNQEYDPLDFRVKHWLKTLLFICGFEGFEQAPQPETTPVIIANLKAHSETLKQNLDTDFAQNWLKEHAPGIREYAGIRNKKYQPRKPIDNLEPGQRQRQPGDFSPSAVTWLLKQFLEKLTGLKMTQTNCTDHQSRCRILLPDQRDLRIRFSMCRQYLRYARSKEKWVEQAREACEHICGQLDIGILPGMDTASSEETPEMPTNDWIQYSKTLHEECNRKEVARTSASRKRKRTEKQPLNAEEKFDQKWTETVEKYVGKSLYEETDAARILQNLCSAGYKVRTKQRMHDAIQKRAQEIAFLKEDQENSIEGL